MQTLSNFRHNPSLNIVTGACPHDCPDTCSWQVAVDPQSGRALDLWGHPDHPTTQGKLCGKVDRYLERTYHRQRLRTPLKRTGPKGSGQFTPVSWPTAVAGIAERLQDVVADKGAEAVLQYSYAGTMGLLQGEGMAQRFFNRLGASRLARTICSEAGFEGYSYTIGATEGTETEAFQHTRFILIWGSNTLTSNVHLWPFIQTARKNGAHVVVIDPARTRTARLADEWIPIRPGTDAALALAMMHVIIKEELIDHAYVAGYTAGFEHLAARVAQWTPDRAADVTGIDAGRIRQLAINYATTQPAAIRINYGLQRHAGGGMAVRTITCLPALIGAWRHVGGGIQLSTSGAFRHMDRSSIQRPDLLGSRIPRTINMNRLGDALSLNPAQIANAHHHPRPVDAPPAPEAAGPPVHALIVYNCNPVAVCPDQSAVIEGMMREDLFTIVLEHFQTDTADYADYLLPATTQLEHWDIIKPYGHLYLALNRPAIAPVGESLPNSEIFRRLAVAMGYDEPCFAQSDEAILREFINSQTHTSFAGITWEALLEQGFQRLNLPAPYLPFAQGNFPTPSGKCEFYSARMAADGYDPVPNYTPPGWTLSPFVRPAAQNDNTQNGNAQPAGAGTLVCISPPAHSFLNSSFANMDRFRGREDTPYLQIHPDDASVRHIQNGAQVRVSNEWGEVRLKAHVTDALIPGTVLAPGIWWLKYSPGGHNINQVVSQTEADMGGGACFYDCEVTVEVVHDEAIHDTVQSRTPESDARLTAQGVGVRQR